MPTALARRLATAAIGICVNLPARAADPPTSGAAPAAPVAVVTAVQGEVQWRRAARRSPLKILSGPGIGDTLELAGGAGVELAFTQGRGRVYSVTGPGRCRLRADGVRAIDAQVRIEERDLAEPWRDVQLRTLEFERASVSLRSAGASELEQRSPRGAQRLRKLQAFRWERPYGRADAPWSYTVRLVDADGNLLWTGSTRETSIAVPQTPAWRRETVYLWSVEASEPEGREVHASAEFTLVSRAVEGRIVALEQALDAARREDAPRRARAEEVLFALALERAGLASEADARWHELAIARPADGH